ncbi:MAG: hypothetical protein SCABRO_02114 [Candidatus Scalindua brodae]|uniref:Transposase n=1 Tax=Candidatus Scalindua brodae TaxID=237368 RepID=A0A0B0ENB0_9BACT|nr:MAG: hypothetical protein SCABRO_02114 [Candidatus Scalindua brodae]
MKLSCPNSECLSNNKNNQNSKNDERFIIKDGSFHRPSDGRVIQRYRCKTCRKRFSSATFNPAYRQNKRRVNHKLKHYLCSGMSMRRAAKLLGVHQITVARKLQFLAAQARMKQDKFLESLRENRVQNFQFDDLITIEHTKCKPLSVTIAVEVGTRKLLGLEVSKSPATGHLAAISRLKYGRREDHRAQGIENLFESIKIAIAYDAKISSDEHKLYPPRVKKYFPGATHFRHKGRRGCVTGQGELKKQHFDPLFDINHACAMIRANVHRLIRRTWNTTKRPDRLLDQLLIYMNYHNEILT